MATKVITGKSRFSFVHVFKPHAQNPGQEPKYSLCLLIPKTDKATLDKIRAAIEEARLNSGPLFGGKVPASLRNPLHDGDGEMPNGGEYADYCKGHWVLNCSSKNPPQVVDAQLNDILDPTEVYSGCYGRASINFYAYNTSGNKGIACGLNNVQKLADGEPLGSRTSAKDDFGSNDFGL